MALTYKILKPIKDMEGHDVIDVDNIIWLFRLWTNNTPSGYYLLLIENEKVKDINKGDSLVEADKSKFFTERDKILSKAKKSLSDFGLAKRRVGISSMHVPEEWLNGYAG